MPSSTHRKRLVLRSLSREVSTGTLRCKADQTQITSVSTQETMRSHVPRKLGAENHATSGSGVAEAAFCAKSSRAHSSSISRYAIDDRES
jgi:hypothetical protein